MSAVVKLRAVSHSPRARRADRPTVAPTTTTGAAPSGSTAVPAGTVTKKQKTGPGSAVAVKVEPASTPRQPLGTNGADVLGGGSIPSAGASASQQQAAAAAIKAAGRRDKEAKMASLKQDEQDFVNKYTRAFPNFVFHFDSVEPGPFGAKARDLGARIDKFFSRSVTHVITSRAVPTFKDKENAPPAPASAAAAGVSAASRRVTIGGTDVRSASTGAKAGTKSAVNPFLDETGQSDVLLKALTFKMKVWDVKKFQSVINRLLPADVSPKKARVQSRHKAANAEAAAATLSHLLEDERKNGTRERDQSAPRPDYQYFTRGAFYVLCEDATGEYRTVIAREYDRPRNGDYPEWPVLHETFLKPSASKFAPPPLPAPASAAAAATAATGPAAAGERPIARLPARLLKGVTGGGGDSNLRRSASLNNLGRASKLATLDDTRHPAAAEHDGAYIAASGNSVNITSTTTSAQSGAAAGNTFDRQGREKAIAELNRKQVAFLPRPAASGAVGSGPSAAAAAVEGSSRPAVSTAVGEPSSVRKRKTKAAMAAVALAEEEAARAAAAAAALEAKVRADHARRELKGAGKMEPPPMKKRHSLPANLGAGAGGGKEKVRLPAREETKKPGYCENCRNKFDDFASHIKSRRHRRFALNDEHFTDLDKVLARLDRQVLGRPRLPQYDRLHLDEKDEEEASDEDEQVDDEADMYTDDEDSAGDGRGREQALLVHEQTEEEDELDDNDNNYGGDDWVRLAVPHEPKREPAACQPEWELVDDEMDGDGDGFDANDDDE